MTNTMTRSYFVKLALIIGALVVINHVSVRPQARAMSEKMDEYQSQIEFVRSGQLEMERANEQLGRFDELISETRQHVLRDLEPDPTLFAHQRLHRYASAHALTVTRVEPLRSVIKQSENAALLTDPIAIDTKEFRMECHGNFNAMLALIADIQRGPYHGQVTSFRMVPTDKDGVRAVMQVRLTELKQFPETMRQ